MVDPREAYHVQVQHLDNCLMMYCFRLMSRAFWVSCNSWDRKTLFICTLFRLRCCGSSAECFLLLISAES